VKVAFFYDKEPQSTLCLWATGSRCYHVGLTDGAWLWDMHLTRRRRAWDPTIPRHYILADCPVPVSAEFLNERMEVDPEHYGYFDYAFFAVRGLLRRLRLPLRYVPNAKGVICSEDTALALIANGWQPPAGFPQVPSPADLEEALLGVRNATQQLLEAAA